MTDHEVAIRAMVFYLAADRKWVSDAQNFMKDAGSFPPSLWALLHIRAIELRVTQMLTRNATRFAQFRELQKKGVAWPHSRKDVEKAGFTYRPMMIKRGNA